MTDALKPDVCTSETECNSFDAVEALGECFLTKTNHQSVFRAADFPWTETLRRDYEVFKDEFFSFTKSSRAPFQRELGGAQYLLAGGLDWRTVPLRLSFFDTRFAKHFPRSMKLIRKSGVDAFFNLSPLHGEAPHGTSPAYM